MRKIVFEFQITDGQLGRARLSNEQVSLFTRSQNKKKRTIIIYR